MNDRYTLSRPKTERPGRDRQLVRCTWCASNLGALDHITSHGQALPKTFAVYFTATHVAIGQFASTSAAALALVELHAGTTGCNTR
ncbi:MAG: hypothetical protein QM753_06735 [Thermomicrobiales bacterium]